VTPTARNADTNPVADPVTLLNEIVETADATTRPDAVPVVGAALTVDDATRATPPVVVPETTLEPAESPVTG
jgi:hypothetical protein